MTVVPRATANRYYLAFNPDFDPEECQMKFRLTYEGRLESNGLAKHKHEIRKVFHLQLERLWDVHPSLKKWWIPYTLPAGQGAGQEQALFYLAKEFDRLGYHFIPLSTQNLSLIAGIEILFLRPDIPGSVIKSGDVDNRLKTLFDALRMPSSAEELGGYDRPAANEGPFFVLLEDDRLISHVAVETDTLFQPTPSANGQFLPNDARLIITVTLKPFDVRADNLLFS